FNANLAATLTSAMANHESFAIICIDLDRFKEVNDVFGHAMGDELLKQVAVRLRGATDGHFLARPGGDELAVVVSGPQPEPAQAVCARMTAAMATEFTLGMQQLDVSLSAGVAVFPADGRDTTTLLGNADAALYQAKAEGKATIHFFDAETDKRLRERR